MTQVQGGGSNYALQWQYLQSIQQQNTDPMLQPSASDPMSFGLDGSAGGSSHAQPTGSGSGASSLLSLGTMSALIDAQAQSSNGLSRDQQRVFGELDADGDGSVSSTELQNAFGSGNSDIAKYVMGKLDTNGDGSISTDEFKAGTTRHAGHHHMHMPPPPDGSQDAQNGQGAQSGAKDPLSQLLSADGANASSSSNADGTTTTTITYADGSKVSMTSAPSASHDGATGSGTTLNPQKNLLEQLIKMQSQLIQSMSASASTSASLATI